MGEILWDGQHGVTSTWLILLNFIGHFLSLDLQQSSAQVTQHSVQPPDFCPQKKEGKHRLGSLASQWEAMGSVVAHRCWSHMDCARSIYGNQILPPMGIQMASSFLYPLVQFKSSSYLESQQSRFEVGTLVLDSAQHSSSHCPGVKKTQ